MKTFARTFGLIALTGLCAVAPAALSVADETVVHQLRNPEAYLVGRAPVVRQSERGAAAESAGAERSAAIIGSYTVIPNATPGLNSNFSFIRFPNFNSDISTVTTVRMIGDATGTDYGTASVESPPWSSPQRSITELYQSIDGVSFNPADTTLTLYLQNNQVLTGVQHVYYNSISDFFENMSACTHVDGVSYIPMGTGVVNVHTTTLQSRFPSVVKVHNRGDATQIRLRVHDGPTGNLLGVFGFNAAANSTYAFTSQQIEAAIGYIPTAANFHMNIFFDGNPSAPTYNAIITHTVTNVRVSGSTLNLTTICNIND